MKGNLLQEYSGFHEDFIRVTAEGRGLSIKLAGVILDQSMDIFKSLECSESRDVEFVQKSIERQPIRNLIVASSDLIIGDILAGNNNRNGTCSVQVWLRSRGRSQNSVALEYYPDGESGDVW